jgi:hypothetical protein
MATDINADDVLPLVLTSILAQALMVCLGIGWRLHPAGEPLVVWQC